MSENNHSIFCIPRFEIVSIKDDDFFFSKDYNKGSIGTSVFVTELLHQFQGEKRPCTIYLYGLGVISNERSENFNYPPSRPDLLVCEGAIKPKVLIDVKYQEFNTEDEFYSFMDTLTKGTRQVILCNTEEFDNYLLEAEKLKCPIYIVKAFRLNREKHHEYCFIGLKLSEAIQSILTIGKAGNPKRDVYFADIEHMLDKEELFKKIRLE